MNYINLVYSNIMCWNFEVSLLSGLFSYTIGIYLWMRNYKNDRWHAIILLCFSSIQFWEAILWYNKNNNNNISSSAMVATTLLIPLTLALEPVASLYGGYYVGKDIETMDIVIYGCAFVFMFYFISQNTAYPNEMQPGGIEYAKPSDSYVLGYVGMIVFFILLVYPLLKYNDYDKFYIFITVVLFITLLLAYFRGSSIGSHWCLYSNVFAVIALFYPFIT